MDTVDHGKDNTVGTTREVHWAGIPFEEKLTRYKKSENGLDMVWKLNNGPLSFPPTSVLSHVDSFVVEGYTNRFEVTSICGGTATMVHFPGFWCANKPVASYDLVVRLKATALSGVSLKLKAAILRDGACPTIRK